MMYLDPLNLHRFRCMLIYICIYRYICVYAWVCVCVRMDEFVTEEGMLMGLA